MDLSSTGDGFIAYPSICFECYTARDLGATRLVRGCRGCGLFMVSQAVRQASHRRVVVDATIDAIIHRRFCLRTRIIRRMRISRKTARAARAELAIQP